MVTWDMVPIIIQTFIFAGINSLQMAIITELNSIVKSIRSLRKKANFTGDQFQDFDTQCVTSVTCSIHFTRTMS